MLNNIAISTDTLRPKNIASGEESVFFHEKRINKYYHFLEYQLRQATGLNVGQINANDENGFNMFEFYHLCGFEDVSVENWLKIFNLDPIPDEAIEYYQQFIDDTLVVYHEIPDIFMAIHNKLAIPYLDVLVHPIRFSDDHFWGMRTNSPQIFDKLRKFAVDPHIFHIQANGIKAIAAHSPLEIEANSALLIGQTLVDKALISNGRCLSLKDFYGEIHKLGNDFNKVYFKPHPHLQNDSSQKNYLAEFPFVQYINANAYKLLAHDNISKVIAISSSILEEAPFFGKQVSHLMPPRYNYAYSKEAAFAENCYLPIYDQFFNPQFWNVVLHGSVPVSVDCSNVEIPHRSNRIRSTFYDYWAHTEIDASVRIVRNHYEPKFDKILKRLATLEKQNNDLNKLCKNLSSNANVKTSAPPVKAGSDGVFKKKLTEVGRSFSRALKNYRAFRHFQKVALKDRTKGSFSAVDNIHCLTYRPFAPGGGRGGAGAVMTCMMHTLGDEYKNLPIRYDFSEDDGIWHTEHNSYFNASLFPKLFSKKSNLLLLWAAIQFVMEVTSGDSPNTLYICHEYGTGCALALLKKKYVLIIHSQGPRIEERANLNEPINRYELDRYFIKKLEAMAAENALYTCFPSNGARDYFFNSKQAGAKRDKVNIGPSLYNTLYFEVTPTPTAGFKDLSSLKFLSVGTVTKAKGQDQLISFFRRLAASTDREIEWCMVGRGPLVDQVVTAAKGVARQYDNFKFTHVPKCSYPESIYLQRVADIYIMFHRISIFDLATLEAMKNNSMLILSKIGGNLEFNKKDNVLFFEKSYDQLVRHLLNVDIDEYKARNLQAYNQYFSPEAFKNGYANIMGMAIEKIHNELSDTKPNNIFETSAAPKYSGLKLSA